VNNAPYNTSPFRSTVMQAPFPCTDDMQPLQLLLRSFIWTDQCHVRKIWRKNEHFVDHCKFVFWFYATNNTRTKEQSPSEVWTKLYFPKFALNCSKFGEYQFCIKITYWISFYQILVTRKTNQIPAQNSYYRAIIVSLFFTIMYAPAKSCCPLEFAI